MANKYDFERNLYLYGGERTADDGELLDFEKNLERYRQPSKQQDTAERYGELFKSTEAKPVEKAPEPEKKNYNAWDAETAYGFAAPAPSSDSPGLSIDDLARMYGEKVAEAEPNDWDPKAAGEFIKYTGAKTTQSAKDTVTGAAHALVQYPRRGVSPEHVYDMAMEQQEGVWFDPNSEYFLPDYLRENEGYMRGLVDTSMPAYEQHIENLTEKSREYAEKQQAEHLAIEEKYGEGLSDAARFMGRAIGGTGQLAVQAGLGIVAPWAVLPALGISAAGNTMAGAVLDGYDLDKAMAYGALSGLSEMGLESLSSVPVPGLKKIPGLTSGLLDDAIEAGIKKLPTWAHGAARILAGAVGEGFEELAGELIDPFLKVYTGMEDELKWGTKEEMFEAFAGGVVPSLIMGGAGAAGNRIYNNITGRSQTAADASKTDFGADGAAAPATAAEGLTAPAVAERSPLSEASMRQVEQMGTDDGEAGIKALNENLPAIGEEGFNDFKQYYDLGKAGVPLEAARDNLTTTADPAVLERAHAAGVTDAKEAAKNIVFYGKDSGLVKDRYSSRLDSKSRVFLNALGQVTGTKVQVVRSLEADTGIAANAMYKEGVITISLDADNPIKQVMSHELTHRLRETAPDAYTALSDNILGMLRGGEKTGSRSFDALVERYKQMYESGDTDYVSEEIVADFVGEMLSDSKALESFVKDNRSAGEKLLDLVRDLVNKLRGHKLPAEYRSEFEASVKQLAEAEGLLVKALEQAREAAEGEAAAEGQGEARFSLKAVAPVEPESETWRRGATFDEVKAAHPTLFALDADEADTRNPTQIVTTVNTYRKIYDKLKAEGFEGTILDASSGLGVGTEAGRAEYGFKVDDIEPFPASNYSPAYTDYSGLDKTYDVVISNAVLNVLPQDLRDAMTVKIGQMLKPGGRAFINVRGTDVKTNKSNIAIDPGQMEYFVSSTGSYQKGFTRQELVGYLSDALGEGFTVQPTNEFGAVAAVVTRDGGKADTKVRFSLKRDSESRELSEAQEEFFKNSKVRLDEDGDYWYGEGNLLPVYHATDAEFTVFDKGRAGANTDGHAGDEYIEATAHVGFWFNTSDLTKQTGTKRAEKVYLDIKRPYEAGTLHGLTAAIEAHSDGGTPAENAGAFVDWLEREGYDGVMINDEEFGGLSFAALSPEQIKRTDNLTPTADPDIRFSLKKPVEETKNLIALHNLTEQKLLGALELGGFPMPSIAVTKIDIPHTNFGNITLVMNKSVIDPKANKRNTVYSADAWTPTFPRIEYEADPKAEKRLRDKYYDLARRIGYDNARPLYDYVTNTEDALNRRGGEQGIIDDLLDDTSMKNLYLQDIGRARIEDVQRETTTRLPDYTIEFYDHLIEALGKDAFGGLYPQGEESPVAARRRWLAANKTAIEDAYREYYRADGIPEADIDRVMEHEDKDFIKTAIGVRNYLRDGAATTRTEYDAEGTRKAIEAAVDPAAYKQWLHETFGGLVRNTGIYNEKDIFTPSGNRRSFKQTHYPVTLDNITKAMAARNDGNSRNVSGFYGIKSLRAGTAERFKSIADMHAREGRLQKLTQEQADAVTDTLNSRLLEIMGRVLEASPSNHRNSLIAMDSIGEIMIEAAEKGDYSVGNIGKVFAQYKYDIGPTLAAEIRDLLFDTSQMPVTIFEGKPERSVRFDEVLAAVLPDDASESLRGQLERQGVPVVEYKAGDEGARLEAVNSVEGARFSRKRTDNLTPTADPDIRFSLKKLDDAKAELARLEGVDVFKLDLDASRERRAEIAKLKRRIYNLENPRSEAQKALAKAKSAANAKIDKQYFAAIEAGDIEAARIMVEVRAKERGYSPSEDYRGDHTAPTDDGYNAPLYDLTRIYPDDIYSGDAVRYYGDGEAYDHQAIAALRKAKGEPDKKITIYRAVPAEVKEGRIRNGDWVSVSRAYAEAHGRAQFDKYKIIWEKVPAKHVFTDGNSLSEQGYDNGRDMAYSDTKNSAKLLDAITYDSDGGIIPLSKRFDKRQYDERFSLKRTAASDESAQLTELNALLREQYNEAQRSLEAARAEFKLTESPRVDEGKAEAAIKKLLRENLADKAEGSYDPAAVSGEIIALWNGMMAEGSYGETREAAMKIAQKIVENASELNDSQHKSYAELRSLVRGTPVYVADQIKADLPGGYAAFRKKNFGRMNLVKDRFVVGEPNRRGPDTLYIEIAERWPGMFPEDIINPADQLAHIAEVLDGLKPVYENPFAADMDYAVESMGYDLIEMAYDIPQKRTFADEARQAQLMERLKGQNKLDALREQKNERIKDIIARGREQREAAVRREKARREAAVEKLETKYRAKEQGAREKQKSRVLREKIKKHTEHLSKLLLKPTDKQHIPMELQQAVAGFLSEVDFNTDRIQGKRIEHLADLKTAYEHIANGQSEAALDFDPDLVDNIDAISKARLVDMNSEELETLYRVVLAVRKSVEMANRTFAIGKAREISAIAYDADAEMGKIKEHNQRHGIARMGDDLFNLHMLAPADYFEQLGGTMKGLYDEIRAGFDKKVNHIREATEFIAPFIEGENIREWTGTDAKTVTVKLTTGTMELTPAQIMSFYRLSLQPDAVRHMEVGGAKPNDMVQLKKDGKAEVKKSTAPLVLTDADIRKIVDLMTPEQKKVADAIGAYFADDIAEWGNEASLKMYGYKKFTVKNYFPIVSDRNYVPTSFAAELNASLKEMGITKARNQAAVNPIIIEDIFDVFTRQVDRMSSYNAFVMPLADMERVYNYRRAVDDGAGGRHVVNTRQGIERAFGTGAKTYLENLMRDINGKVNTEAEAALMRTLTRNFKAAAVGGNIRVVIQQPTSYARAGSMIDAKYLARGLEGLAKTDWETVKQYSAIAQWKDWGYFSLDTGRQIKDILVGDTGNLAQRVIEKGMDYAGKADEVTWKALWRAVELETLDRQPGLKEGTDAFNKAVGKRFSDIIDRTQVVDSVFHRTAMMRSENDALKMATSFMSEPMKSYNGLRTSFENARRNPTTENKKQFVRTVAATYGSMITNAMVLALFDSYWRRPDEEEDKRYWETVFWNVMEDTFGMAPFVRDLLSLWQGYSVERMDMEAASAVVRSLLKIGKWFEEKGYKKESKHRIPYLIQDSIKSVSTMLGLPTKNISRELESAFKVYVKQTGSNWVEYEAAKVFYHISHESNRSRFIDILYKAFKEGDDVEFRRIQADMIDSGVPPSKIRSGLRSRYDKDEDTEKGVKALEKMKGDPELYSFTTLLGVELKTAPKEETEEKYTIDNLDGEGFQFYQDTQLSRLLPVVDKISSDPLYIMMKEQDRADAISAAYAYADQTALAAASGGEYEPEHEWIRLAATAPEDLGLSTANYILYKSIYGAAALKTDAFAAAMEADVDPLMYLGYAESIKDFTADYKDGKAVSGSEKAKILAEIDKLPIARWQKDEMYLSEGYAVSKIEEAPWNRFRW